MQYKQNKINKELMFYTNTFKIFISFENYASILLVSNQL